MALITTGTPITDISGKMAGNIFSRDRSGLHIRAHIPKRDPRSALQDKRRKAFSCALNAWNTHSWTESEISQWSTWAQHHPRLSRMGHTYTLSPYQAFLHLNLYRCYTGLVPSYVPPSD